MRIRNAILVVCLCLLGIVASARQASATPPVVMKILVLAGNTSEPSYQAIITNLGQIGVPYQSVALSSTAKDSSGNRLSKLTLSDTTTGRGLYQGIIVTDSTFAACGTSCLSSTDWTKLNTYASQFSVRLVSYFTLPQAQWGLVAADSGATYTVSNPLNVTLTDAGATVFSYLNPSGTISVTGQGTTGVRAYRATTTAAANETTTPLLVSGAFTVAATHTTADGRETLALTMDNSPTLLHSLALGYGVINWVTKGVFLGSRKVYLNPQIDDMLFGNRLYAPTLPECPGAETCPTVYATGQDLQTLVAWQNNMKADPLFSGFRTTFAFNGVGSTWFDKSDPVFAAMASLGSNFTWLTHSWDHANLDCYSTSNTGACVPANLSQSLAELNNNINVAPSLGITLDRTSMVTPFNGGLGNPNFISAAVQAGLQYIVTPLLPSSPNTGVVNPLNSAIYEIPRVSPPLYDDVSSPQAGVYGSWPDEYNAMFGPSGTQPTYSTNQTYAQILDNESRNILLGTMLTYEPYLLAFHICNSSTYDGVHSLYSDLMDATAAKYKSIFNIPVLTLDMKDLAPVLKTRQSFNASGVVGVYTPGVSIALTATKAATIPVTGACSQTSCGTYGGQMQDNVVVAANTTVTLPLTATEGVALSSMSVNPSSVTGGTSATGTVTLSGAAPTTGAVVALSSSSPSASVPASVTVAPGGTTATFTISTVTVTSAGTSTLTATYGSASKTADLSITPAAASLAAISVSPSSVTGGTSATGTVTLSGAAPTGGAVVSISSSSASASALATVTVLAGSTTATFPVSTTAVASSASATLTATYGSTSRTTALNITPVAVSLTSLSVSPATVTGGASATGTVTLSAAAPTGGATVSLSSSNASAVVGSSVIVAAGNTTATFAISTAVVSSTTSATLAATYSGASRTATLSVTPSATAALGSLSIAPASVVGGASATGTVMLSNAAPSGGATVSLVSNSAAATVPASITIAAGSTSATFSVSTTSVTSATSVTITGTYGGVNKTATISVTPSASTALSGVAVTPASVAGGTSASGTVTLSGVAPAGGLTVTLASNSTAASLPTSVTVAAGSSTATFTITTNPVSSTATVTVTASANNVSKTASLSVTPVATVSISAVTVSPTSVTGGTTAKGTVTLSAAAPAGGLTVGLWTTGTAAFVAANIPIAAGSKTGTFDVTTTNAATTRQDTITAFYNGATKTATITVTPGVTIGVASISVSPASVKGGSASQGTVTLNAPAPTGGLVVGLWTTGTAAFVPDSVTVAAGSTTATFAITTTPDTTTRQDTVTAFYDGATKTAAISVTP